MKKRGLKERWPIVISVSYLLLPIIGIAEEPAPIPLPPLPSLNGNIYISDDLKTALRTGPTSKHRISAFLSAGTPLKVLSSTDEWVEVDVIGLNKEGWVSRNSVQINPGAKALNVQKNAIIKKLQQDKKELQTTLAELKSTQDDTSTHLNAVSEQFNRLNSEYSELKDISNSAITNHEKLKTIRQDLASLESSNSELEMTQALLREDNYNRGIIHGVIALICGVILTLLIPRLKQKQRSNRW